MQERTHTVVIGSGFGGAVTACRLAEHGDEVVVLERGRVVARGTHDDLLETSPVYREIHDHGLVELDVMRTAEAAG